MAPVGFFSVDEKKMIVECNHTAAKMLGRDQVEINKQPITAFILKEDQDIYYLHCKRPIEKHMPQGCDLRMLKNDGSSLWVNLVTIVFQNDEGVTIRRIVMNNITERKQAEETLRKSVDRYRHLFNSIKDNILVADTNRNIIDCNQALMDGFGYRSDEIIGKKTLTLYNSKKEYQKMGKELRKHFDNTNFIYTIDYKKKSGEIFPGETNVFYLENDKEEVVGFIGIIRDITYRRMVEESLQRSNNELKEKTVELEDTNTALKILLKKREQDNQELEENILSNYESMVNPFLDKLKSNTLNKNQQNLIDIVETTLKEIVTPFQKSCPIL
jgi:PAS domain S-box-containing protein